MLDREKVLEWIGDYETCLRFGITIDATVLIDKITNGDFDVKEEK